MAPSGPFDAKGMDLTSPINRIRAGFLSIASNVRRYIKGGINLRNLLSGPLYTLGAIVNSIRRMNDLTPNGPPSGYVLISASGTTLYLNSTPVALGLTGNPVSLVPLRPNTSVQPWMYTGDASESVYVSAVSSVTPALTPTSATWTNPTNATATAAYASYTETSTTLDCATAPASIPLNATITGIEVSGIGYGGARAPGASLQCQLIFGGTYSNYISSSFNGKPASLLWGSGTNLWGLPITVPMVNAGFTAEFTGEGGAGKYGYLNSVVVTVFYSIPGSFLTTGMIKVRSDATCYKAGVKEPQIAPAVSTAASSVSVEATLEATAIPWTNYDGANPDYDYGESTGYPDPTPDGTAPFIVDCANASTITIAALTGTATINGGSATPTTLGPSTGSSTNPGHYIMEKGTGTTPPATATVVTGAFTDGEGNVIPMGVAPLFIPSVVDVGAVIGVSGAITVPYGAQQFQIGINSTGGTFSANSGSFDILVTVTTESLPTVTAILGDLALYYWGDSPYQGPVGSYIWKNPSDTGGSGPSRSISNAAGSTTGNSFIFDATFTAGIPALPGIGDNTVPMEWTQLSPESVAVGTNAVFQPALTGLDGNTAYQNFNFCMSGNLFIPQAGQYTFVLTYKDDVIWGMGGNVKVISATAIAGSTGTAVSISGQGQTITVVNGYPLLPRVTETSGEGGTYAGVEVVLEFAEVGIYPIEIDYDYWYHSGRILLLEGSATPSGSPTIIPPLPANVRQDTQYRYVYRSSATGATSNPSPASAVEAVPVTSNTVTSLWSNDPQIDVVDYYRIDSATADYTYVATGPNDNLGGGGTNTPITDSLLDTELGSQLLSYDNYEPVPSIDLPQKGICSISGGVITWVSGGAIGGSGTGFNVRWLAGTVILIGSPTSLAYTLIARPTSTTSMTIPGVPDGANVVYEIEEPILAAQPLPHLMGPTDNINYVFGWGDPLRAGTLYWCEGSNLDAWPDTNQADLTDPNEALVGGDIAGAMGVIFSIKRAWIIVPNFFNALANVTGVEGSQWTYQKTSINRGLFMEWCVAVVGDLIFFRVADGIHISNRGSASKSITDDDIYPLFPHEGSVPTAITRQGVTVYPPDDTKPQLQRFAVIYDYLYYDYQGIDGNFHTLVYDIKAEGWIWDILTPAATCRTTDEGVSQQGFLVGCADATIRQMSSSGVESITGTVMSGAIGGKGFMHCGESVVEYSSSAPVTLTIFPADTGNGSYGPPPIILPASATLTKYWFRPGANKWKLATFQFSTNAPFNLNFQGCIAYVRSWGSEGDYVPVPMFGEQGGEG